MILADRIAKYLPQFPPELRMLLDAELAAGNEIAGVEIGRDEDEGKLAIQVNHPFRVAHTKLPPGITYHQLLDRDPMIFEYRTEGSRFSLFTGKFKPMKLDDTVHGPPNPTEAHLKFMEKYRKEQEAAFAKRAAEMAKIAMPTPPRALRRPPGPAGEKFLASMNVTYEMWHDGVGYDLDALAQVPENDLPAIMSVLLAHRPQDWRDVEALAHIDLPEAVEAVEQALKSSDAEIRRTAMEHAAEKVDPLEHEQLLIRSLQNDVLYGGLSHSIDDAEEFHPQGVIDTLFQCTLSREGGVACLFAGLLYFIYGKADSAFDWNHRPFFLRFNTPDHAARKAVFQELCAHVGVDPRKYAR